MIKTGLSATSLENLLEISDKKRAEWGFRPDDLGQPWFRGQQRKHWKLLPSIIRHGCFDRGSEDEIREEFVLRAPALAGQQPMPTNDWDFYFLMQHFGVPTRLIDWTENILVALYFAVRDNPGYYDSAIWMLDPFELNKKVLGKREVLAPSAQGANPRERKLAAPWLPTRWKPGIPPPDPIALHPTHIAMRISNQKSCFTIHGSKEDGLGQFLGLKSKPFLTKIILPSFAIRAIKSSLQRYCIDEATIFPDLEGLGRALVTSYDNAQREKAHRNVYVRLQPSKLLNGGVGVFAIRSIPKGTTIFTGENEEILWAKKSSIPKSGGLRTLYDDFSIIKDGWYGTPPSFNRLTPAWYLNNSKKPNTRCDENYDFISTRDISIGEELSVDYSTYSEEPDFPRK